MKSIKMKYLFALGALLVLGLFVVPVMAQNAKEKAKKTAVKKIKAKKVVLPSKNGDTTPELTKEASKAIDLGLKYLIASQRPDGCWDAKDSGYQVGVGDTSLALMAFMVKGYFPGSGPYAKELDLAKKFLMDRAKKSKDGFLGTSMYEHGLATLAFSEIWGMTKGDKDDIEIQKILELAVEVILRSQHVAGGWRYTPLPSPGDTSITVMQLVALGSARQAGIMVPDTSINRGITYLRNCQTDTGGFSYMEKQSGTSPACSAAGTYALQICGQRESEMVSIGVRYLKEFPEAFFENCPHYYYVHYYAINAMVQSSDEDYREWYPKVRDGMLAKQMQNGAWIGGNGGPPQSTAMAIIVLGTPHRYLPIYQR
jgi:hypothetical protein